MTHLYLIRHGEAVSNVQPIIGGMRGDRGLTPKGVRQAELLRDRLTDTGEIVADIIIASSLPRARQTTEIIRAALGDPQIIYDDEVQELRPGEADGMDEEEARAKFGVPSFRQNPFQQLFRTGESWPQFALRVGIALDRITRDHADKTIVVVCHGGVIQAAFVYFMQLSSFMPPPVEFHDYNTAITHWQYLPRENRPPRWSLERYNDAAHLRGMGDDAPALDGGKQSVPLPTDTDTRGEADR